MGHYWEPPSEGTQTGAGLDQRFGDGSVYSCGIHSNCCFTALPLGLKQSAALDQQPRHGLATDLLTLRHPGPDLLEVTARGLV